MRRLNRSQAHVIAIALPVEQKRGLAPWQALGAGLLTSIGLYILAALRGWK